MITRVGQLALQSIAERRIAQQPRRVLDRGLLPHAPFVLDHSGTRAEPGEQFTEYQRFGQEIVHTGDHGISQLIELGLAQHQKRIRVAFTIPRE